MGAEQAPSGMLQKEIFSHIRNYILMVEWQKDISSRQIKESGWHIGYEKQLFCKV